MTGLLLVAVVVLHYASSRESLPQVPLNAREIELIAEQLNVQFRVAPAVVYVWFSEDGHFYTINLRADFAKSDEEHPFQAEWFTPSHREEPSSIVRMLSSPVPDSVAKMGEMWQALPTVRNDLAYSWPEKKAGAHEMDSWALVRKHGDGLTLYCVQMGEKNRIRAPVREFLNAAPINIGWFMPSQSSISFRTSLPGKGP